MTTRETQLERRDQVAEGTFAFHLRKPAGFAFKPGQAIDLILPGAEANDAGRHAFSLVSAPFEDELVVATRMRDSAFKRALGALVPGAPLTIEGPFGSLTLHNDRARPALFIAGGIGITPFMSMLRQAAHDRREQSLTLLYANHRPEDAAFLDELARLADVHPGFRLVATMTRMDGSRRDWSGARGRIDAALVKSAVGESARPVHYVAGPPAMVAAMREMMNAAGVDDDDIRSEEFYGYS
jgi:ferredoxin-NADP reductase